MEWGKVGVGTLPARFTHRVDDKWDNHDDNAADDKDCNPCGWATGRDLCRRDKTQDKGEQGSAEAKTRDNPHQRVAAEAEWAITTLHLIAQHYCRSEEQHIHYQVERGCHL